LWASMRLTCTDPTVRITVRDGWPPELYEVWWCGCSAVASCSDCGEDSYGNWRWLRLLWRGCCDCSDDEEDERGAYDWASNWTCNLDNKMQKRSIGQKQTVNLIKSVVVTCFSSR
jgi:hypothetical protein